MQISAVNQNQNFGVTPSYPIVCLYKKAAQEYPSVAPKIINEMNSIFDSKLLAIEQRQKKQLARGKFVTRTVDDIFLNCKKVATIQNVPENNGSVVNRLTNILNELKNLQKSGKVK